MPHSRQCIHGYEIASIPVEKGTWLAGKMLNELDLFEEGILIVGIKRNNGSYLGVPRGHYKANIGETLILYGKKDTLSALKNRIAGPVGEAAHKAPKEEHNVEMKR
jgi:Trk K+ transport system NAD-binding subunit